jgi:hypothetical protein
MMKTWKTVVRIETKEKPDGNPRTGPARDPAPGCSPRVVRSPESGFSSAATVGGTAVIGMSFPERTAGTALCREGYFFGR